ncbi:ABC transporter substrate-binding protein [Conexibacter sp. CPCC 206217]|uniref:ABC transporter substrate-binding protein n=1 Tax=Conexibacter sp. CPCC 206217 TaxID=3064574 RepID=UPI0027207F0F|nr:ABC transporter substrate-binding protein [Conexibacter sp. CPCC 206217]MDO8210121.1 ABC transporter substrate-binding protein [Conexibacter sp. CPCC 206217]
MRFTPRAVTGLAVTAACTLTLMACGSSDDSGAETQAAGGDGTLSAKVAVINDVSGALAFVGGEQQNAAKLAIEDVNGSDLGVELTGDFKDSQSKPASAVSQTQSALSDGADAILGFNLTEAGNAVQPLVGSDGVPTIFFQVTQLPDRTDNVFSMGPPTRRVSELGARAVLDAVKPRTAAILWVQQPTLTEAAEAFRSTFEAAGVKVPVYEGASLETTNFDTQVAKAVAANPDVVAIAGTGPQDGAMLPALRSRGFRGAILAQQAADAPSTRKAAGDAFDGLYVGTYWNAAASNADARKFLDLYARAYPSDPPPDVYALQAWDAVHAYAQAVKRAGSTDHEKVNEALASETFPAAMQDEISFASDGFADLGGYVVRMTPDGADVLVRRQG